MELLLLNIDSEVEQLISDLYRARSLVCHSVFDITAALERLRAGEIDAVLVSASGSAVEPEARASLVRTCRVHGVSFLLLIDDVAQLRQLDDDTRSAIDDFILPPHDAEHLGARLDLLTRRRRLDSLRQAILHALPDMMFCISRDGTYVGVQAPDARQLGLSSAQLLGARVSDVLPPEHAQRCMDAIQQVLATRTPACLEYSVPAPDGVRFYEARMVRSSADEVLVLVRDVTERRRVEEQCRVTALAKQAFASRVLSTLEAERHHLSRELHDSISQLLLVHRMDAEWMAREADTDPVRDAAERLCSALDETLHLVRTLAMDLRPPSIDDLGLGSALETLCMDVSRRSGIRCQFHRDERMRTLPEDTGVTMFRIAQEALANAVRHAKCRNIQVQLLEHTRGVELCVADDGVGIEPARLADTASFGLVGMRERAELVGGHVSIQTDPNHGTCVRAVVPFSPYRPSAVNHQGPPREGKP